MSVQAVMLRLAQRLSSCQHLESLNPLPSRTQSLFDQYNMVINMKEGRERLFRACPPASTYRTHSSYCFAPRNIRKSVPLPDMRQIAELSQAVRRFCYTFCPMSLKSDDDTQRHMGLILTLLGFLVFLLTFFRPSCTRIVHQSQKVGKIVEHSHATFLLNSFKT